MSGLICPVCGEYLDGEDKTVRCPKGHSFDRAKEGYLNLNLRPSKSMSGDAKPAVDARRKFLDNGHYDFMLKEIRKYISGTVTDICCGEGHYTNGISDLADSVFAFDLSKEAIKTASKRYKGICFFTANISAIPLSQEISDTCIHICAPVHETEFPRILKKTGIFIDVIPSPRHLWQIKEFLYDVPYENDGHSQAEEIFKVSETITCSSSAVLTNEDIRNLITMTPYAFRTPKEKLNGLFEKDRIETETGFCIRICKKDE